MTNVAILLIVFIYGQELTERTDDVAGLFFYFAYAAHRRRFPRLQATARNEPPAGNRLVREQKLPVPLDHSTAAFSYFCVSFMAIIAQYLDRFHIFQIRNERI